MQKIWESISYDETKSEALSASLNSSNLIAQLLTNRGIETKTDALIYLRPEIEHLHDPFLISGMDKAVERLRSAIKNKENIWIYGDYDVDGVTSTSLLINIFNYYEYPIQYYIPSRFSEGYGLNNKAIHEIKDKGCQVLITVDCGITAKKEVDLCNDLGIDVIVTDHHQIQNTEKPNAFATVTLRNEDSEYPFHDLTGVGLAFKLAHGLLGGGKRIEPILQNQLDLVALGTIADIAPLIGENRILTNLGLKEINKRKKAGIQALCDTTNWHHDKTILSHTLSFIFGPRINAAGRMGDANQAVRLLTSDSYQESIAIAQELEDANKQRKEIQKKITEEACEILEQSNHAKDRNGLVVASRNWHIGVIGIVASRLREEYYKPIFVLSIDGDEAHGSGRSIEGINLMKGLKECKDLLKEHGGHEAAAGIVIETKNIERFAARFNDYINNTFEEDLFIPKLKTDFEIKPEMLTLKAVKELQFLEPFGQYNTVPRFIMHNLKQSRSPIIIGKNKNHIKIFISEGEENFDILGWGMADLYNELNRYGTKIDIVFHPEINEWQGTEKVQLILTDIKIH